MLVRQMERIARAKLVDKIVVATSTDSSDDPLEVLANRMGWLIYRGSLDDVLDRFAKAAAQYPAEHVVRLTGDCPLTDPDIIDAVIAHHLVCAADITTNSAQPSFPDGLDVEVMRFKALMTAADQASLGFEREHVTQFLYRRPERFQVAHYQGPINLSGLRWTVDEPADLTFVRAVYEALYTANPTFGWQDVLRLLDERPALTAINSQFRRNEGLESSIAKEAEL